MNRTDLRRRWARLRARSIANRLLAVAMGTVTVSVRGLPTIPRDISLYVNPEDLGQLIKAKSWLEIELVEGIQEAARRRGWQVQEPLQLAVIPSLAQTPGRPAARSSFAHGDTAVTAPAPDRDGTGALTERQPPSTSVGLLLTDTRTTRKIEILLLDEVPCKIGRSEHSEIIVDDVHVSREHCQLVARGHSVYVTDLGSLNGTSVDGQPVVEETRLGDGARLKVGHEEWIIRLQS